MFSRLLNMTSVELLLRVADSTRALDQRVPVRLSIMRPVPPREM